MGPFYEEQARVLVAQGLLNSQDLGWRPGNANWVVLGVLLNIPGYMPVVPQQYSAGSSNIASGQRPNSRIVFILLAVFLGALGIHNFYAGYTGKGIGQLLLTVLTFGFGCWIAWIWAVIEAVTIQEDARGVPFV